MKEIGYQLEICQKVGEGHRGYGSDHRNFLAAVEGVENIPKPTQ